ncbi:hypothetical protein THOD04_70222 [Vibrio owensii]|nr:hypothetical protein THOD04_70222 [Vibrio owensii]
MHSKDSNRSGVLSLFVAARLLAEAKAPKSIIRGSVILRIVNPSFGHTYLW